MLYCKEGKLQLELHLEVGTTLQNNGEIFISLATYVRNHLSQTREMKPEELLQYPGSTCVRNRISWWGWVEGLNRREKNHGNIPR